MVSFNDLTHFYIIYYIQILDHCLLFKSLLNFQSKTNEQSLYGILRYAIIC